MASTSLDGYIAGPNDEPDNPGGDGFDRLHEWFGDFSRPSGPVGELFDEQIDHWGGDRHGVPIFVPSHRPPGPSVANYPLVTYVTDGIIPVLFGGGRRLFEVLPSRVEVEDVEGGDRQMQQCPLERLRAAGIAKGVAALAAIGADPTRWDLAGWNTNMAWAFKTNVPTPNLDRRLLFPLALSSPIYSLRELFTLFVGFQWSTARMFRSCGPMTPENSAPASRSRSTCSRASAT